jgi:hypothetical protein
MSGTSIPYPQPYTQQDEQRATRRIERPVPRDRQMGVIKIIVGVALLIVLAVVGMLVLG